mgnify:CR=1 FL=1
MIGVMKVCQLFPVVPELWKDLLAHELIVSIRIRLFATDKKSSNNINFIILLVQS